MQNNEVSRLFGDVGGAIDDNLLWDLDVKIEWEVIAEIYGIFDEVGTCENGFFNKHPTDLIIVNIFKKNKSLFKDVFLFIANRYNLVRLKQCLDEYEYIFDDDLEFSFDGETNVDNLKMFISFSNKDGEEAVKIQDFFKNCGVDCFLSKTSIDISEQYKSRVFDEIYNADIFIYLLSKNSKTSDWCDQEMGMAYIKYKLGNAELFVVSHDGSIPYGFLSSFNAGSTCDANYLLKIAKKIDEKLGSSLVFNIKQYYNESIDLKIKDLSTADSYKSAKRILNFLNKRSEWLNKIQLKRICQISLRNNQIYESFICKKPLKSILSDHKEDIDDELYHKVLNKINSV